MGDVGVKQEGSYRVVDCSNFTFGFSILWGGVRTGKSKGHAVFFEKFMKW